MGLPAKSVKLQRTWLVAPQITEPQQVAVLVEVVNVKVEPKTASKEELLPSEPDRPAGMNGAYSTILPELPVPTTTLRLMPMMALLTVAWFSPGIVAAVTKAACPEAPPLKTPK